MSGQFQPYQDENSLLGQAQRPRENPKSLPGFGPGKRVLSGTRQALGNITNNGSVQSAKQAVSREVMGEVRKQDKAQQERVPSTSGRTYERTYEDACIDELMRGGVECPAGMTWDEQQALREMELMDGGMIDAAGHKAALIERVGSLCRSVQGDSDAVRREIIDEVFRDDDAGTVRLSREEIEPPASPTNALCILKDIDDVLP